MGLVVMVMMGRDDFIVIVVLVVVTVPAPIGYFETYCMFSVMKVERYPPSRLSRTVTLLDIK